MLPSRPSVSRSAFVTVVTLLLAVHAWLALSATIDLGVTADETAHLTGGYSYWRFDDYRLQPENGNLPQRWAALPLLPERPRLDPSAQPDAWRRSNVWLVAQQFFFGSGNPIDYLLLLARTGMLAWSVATGLLVFAWSRQLWGDAAGLFSLTLYAFSPTLLAHGPLVTSDVCAAFWLLAAAGAWWRVSRRIDARWLTLSLVAAGGAAVAKFSCVLLLPVAGALALWRILQPEPVAVAFAGPAVHRVSTRPRKAAVLALLGVAHVLAAALVVWACFGFRFSAFAPGLPAPLKFFSDWNSTIPAAGLGHAVFTQAHRWHLLPEAYLQGFAFVLWAAQERGAFLAGEFSTRGWWWFFPYAFLVKSTLVELAAAVGVGALALGRVVRGGARAALAAADPLAPLLVFAAVYGGVSLTSHLNIGQRHILPLYPVLFILAGALAGPAMRSWRRLVAPGLAVLAVGAALAVRPDYLAYFNPLVGGPAQGWRHLVDSSLDWGQNVPKLAGWLGQHRAPGEKVYVSMFGTDDLAYHGIQAEELSPYYSFGRDRRWVELQPGWYCVSATMLQDVYSPYAGPWTLEHELAYRKLLRLLRAELAEGTRRPELGEFGRGPERLMWNLDRARFARLCLYLRVRRPEAVIGHSIFVHHLDAEEVRVVVDGSLSELAARMEAITRPQGR
jgi:hypothetical protein